MTRQAVVGHPCLTRLSAATLPSVVKVLRQINRDPRSRHRPARNFHRARTRQAMRHRPPRLWRLQSTGGQTQAPESMNDSALIRAQPEIESPSRSTSCGQPACVDRRSHRAMSTRTCALPQPGPSAPCDPSPGPAYRSVASPWLRPRSYPPSPSGGPRPWSQSRLMRRIDQAGNNRVRSVAIRAGWPTPRMDATRSKLCTSDRHRLPMPTMKAPNRDRTAPASPPRPPARPA